MASQQKLGIPTERRFGTGVADHHHPAAHGTNLIGRHFRIEPSLVQETKMHWARCPGAGNTTGLCNGELNHDANVLSMHTGRVCCSGGV